MSSSRNKSTLVSLIIAAAGAAYPFIVYGALGKIPAGAFVALALALIGARIIVVERRSSAAACLIPPLAAAAAATLVTGVISPDVGMKAYPVVMSWSFAAAFAMSLRQPASLVELFARSVEPSPSEAARSYMRTVSKVWAVFLWTNGMVSAATALWAGPWIWAFYNGLLSYLLMGALFAGEWLVRRRVRAREIARP